MKADVHDLSKIRCRMALVANCLLAVAAFLFVEELTIDLIRNRSVNAFGVGIAAWRHTAKIAIDLTPWQRSTRVVLHGIPLIAMIVGIVKLRTLFLKAALDEHFSDGAIKCLEQASKRCLSGKY